MWRDWVAAHRKILLGLVGSALILVVDQDTADAIIGGLTLLLAFWIPNDDAAVARVYNKAPTTG